jgi:hypothetical protein
MRAIHEDIVGRVTNHNQKSIYIPILEDYDLQSIFIGTYI